MGARCTLQGHLWGRGGAALWGWKVLCEEVRFLSDVEVWRRYLSGGRGRGGSKALWGNRVLCDEELVVQSVGATEGLWRKKARGCEHCMRGRGRRPQLMRQNP